MTMTDFLGGKIRLAQARTGHRAGTDAILLAALVAQHDAGHLIDAGAGTGAAGLCVAARYPEAILRLVEIDADQCALAQDNIAENRLSSRVSVVEADLFGSFAERQGLGLTQEDASCVITNPPFLDPTRDRTTPDPDKARAHVMPEGGLALWLKSCRAMLAPQGRLHLIHRADRLTEVLEALSIGFGALAIRPVHPRKDENASRILVSAVKGSRAPLTIQPGFVLHDADGRFTPEADAIHRGLTGFNAD